MTDRLTKAQRSALMSRIKGRGNSSTEVVFARLLRQNSITGWRRHMGLPGSPDFAFPARKVAVFLDGCFWHGCPRHFKAPASNRRFWVEKMNRNRNRDRRDSRRLRTSGWKVLRIWEHELRSSERPKLLSKLLRGLRHGNKAPVPGGNRQRPPPCRRLQV